MLNRFRYAKYFIVFIAYLIAGFIFNGNHKWMILTTLLSVFAACYFYLSKAKHTSRYKGNL